MGFQGVSGFKGFHANFETKKRTDTGHHWAMAMKWGHNALASLRLAQGLTRQHVRLAFWGGLSYKTSF